MKNGKQRLVDALIVLVLLPMFGCNRQPKDIPPDHVKMTVYTPNSSETSSLDVLVNNNKVGEAERGESVVISFPSMPNGKNTVEFVSGRYKTHSKKQEFQATPGAELNVTVQYSHYDFLIADHIAVDIRTVKEGEPLASITGASIEPEIIRRDALKEVVRGDPGTKYQITRSRTIQRQIVLSESAKLEASASASVGFGLVDVTAGIKQTLSKKDTVLLRDKEEVTRSVEVVLNNSGTATIQWVDLIKKGKALYKYNGKTKELEFEVLDSSELTILK